MAASNYVTKTAARTEIPPLENDLNNQQHSSDNTVDDGCSSLQDTCGNSAANANRLEVKIREAADKHETTAKNISAAKRKSPRAKGMTRKQICGRTHLELKQQLSCRSCKKTFSLSDDSVEWRNGITEKFICLQCQSLVAKTTHESKQSETVIKSRDVCGDVCVTVDTTGISPEWTDVSAVDSKQPGQDGEQNHDAMQPLNSVDGGDACRS